eukprot:CAMPEP_0174698926 /NCGR_PEP_ID=MMETSP1094-20130205/4373_1 /TAXON_ID=156173 /ORGANISM="Chrysochromulina brevifilum, Strain UTEX LB 985" /LENGTH=80 /DNA_ID=CAMNT_0015896169 /DNA_START=406 /DNA_END=645 /DNA_ORIENTATION=+
MVHRATIAHSLVRGHRRHQLLIQGDGRCTSLPARARQAARLSTWRATPATPLSAHFAVPAPAPAGCAAVLASLKRVGHPS